MKLAAIFLALSVGTAQADEPRYDNTSIETLKASAQEVMASMDPEGKAADEDERDIVSIIRRRYVRTVPCAPKHETDPEKDHCRHETAEHNFDCTH